MAQVYVILEADRGGGVQVVGVYRHRSEAQLVMMESSHYFARTTELYDEDDEDGYEDDGQPTEMQEWQDYDRDC